MPEGIDAVIERAVAKDPADRYPSAAATDRGGAGARGRRSGGDPGAHRRKRADRRCASGRRPATRRPRVSIRARQWLGASVALLAGAVALAVILLGGDDVSVSDPIPVGDPPLRLAAGPSRSG